MVNRIKKVFTLCILCIMAIIFIVKNIDIHALEDIVIEDILDSRVILMDFEDKDNLNVYKQFEGKLTQRNDLTVIKNDIDLTNVEGILGQGIQFGNGDDYIGLDSDKPLIESDSGGITISLWAKNWHVNYQSMFTIHDFENNIGAELLSASMSYYPIESETGVPLHDQRNSFPTNTAGWTSYNNGKTDSFQSKTNNNLDTYGEDNYSLFTITIDAEDGVHWYRDGVLKYAYPIEGTYLTGSIETFVESILNGLKSNQFRIKLHSGFFGTKSVGDSIDEFTIYNRVLSSDGVSTLHKYYIDHIDYGIYDDVILSFDMDDVHTPSVLKYDGNQFIENGDWQATLVGEITQDTGRFDNGYYFGQREQYVNLTADQPILAEEDNAVSFSIWAKNWDKDWQGLVSVLNTETNTGADITFGNTQKYDLDPANKEPIFESRANTFPGKAQARKHHGGDWDSFLSVSGGNVDTFGQDNYSFFTFVISQKEGIKFYRDGDLKIHYPSSMPLGKDSLTVEDTANEFIQGLKANTPTIRLHKGVMNVGEHTGSLDDFKIYEAGLTAQQIKKIYRSSLAKTTITLEANGGNSLPNIIGIEGESLTLPLPVKLNYRFEGWYTDTGFTNLFVSNVFPDEHITLYAKWGIQRDIHNHVTGIFNMDDLESLKLQHFDDGVLKENENFTISSIGNDVNQIGGIENKAVSLGSMDGFKFTYEDAILKDINQGASFSFWTANATFDWHGAITLHDYKHRYGVELTFGNVMSYNLDENDHAIWSNRVTSFPSKPGVYSHNGAGWDTFLTGAGGDKYASNRYMLVTITIDNEQGIHFYRDGVLKLHYTKDSLVSIAGQSHPTQTIESIINNFLTGLAHNESAIYLNYSENPGRTSGNSYDDFRIYDWQLSSQEITDLYDSYDLGYQIKWFKGDLEVLPMSYAKDTVYLPTIYDSGQTLIGWYLDSNFELKWNDELVIAENIELYSLFAPEAFEIIYHLDGGGNHPDNVASYIHSSEGVILYEPYKEGYIFLGWYRTSDFKNKISKIMPYSQGNIELFAQFQKIDETQYVEYELNGGQNHPNNTKLYLVDDNFELEPASKIGFDFLGWYLEADFKTEVKRLDRKINKLYAKFEKKQIVYHIEYALDGGINHVDNKSEFSANEGINLFDPIKKGHIFMGWYLDLDYTQRVEKVVTNNETVYAKWQLERLETVKRDETINIVYASVNLVCLVGLVVGILYLKKRVIK